MNCEEFRSQYNGWLDGRKSSPLHPEAVLHARSCSACESYSRVMIQIDAGLQNLPGIALPEEILALARKYEAHPPRGNRELSSLLRREAPVVLPAIAAWIISLFLPPVWQIAIQFILVSGAMALFAVTCLRPRFIA